jgi:hypothetical protein
MTTVAVTPIGRQQEASNEVIRLVVYVTEAEKFELYNQLEIWKSKDTTSGPYREQTGAEVRGARIPKDAPDEPTTPETGPSAVLVGKDLRLLINEQDELTITFTGADPLTFADAAAQVDAQGQGLVRAYVSELGGFVLQTTFPGVGSLLRVVGGEAAPLLGLPTDEPDSLAQGIAARLTLSQGTTAYEFLDLWGSSEYYYKVRFRNSTTGAVSEFSQYFPGSKRLGLEPSSLAIGTVTLVTTEGKPLVNQEVRVNIEHTGAIIDDKLVAGGDAVQLTDETGKVEFTLPRGQKVSVAIAGTRLVRTITVPDQDIFNLLDPNIADQDIFRVQVPELVMAERRSL